jgi:TP901 family phage tail tape measure protein
MAGAAGGIQVGAGILDIKLQFPDLGKAAKGVGDAMATVGKGIGSAVASAIKAQGTGAAAQIRAQGSAMAALAKANNPAMAMATANAVQMRAQASAQATQVRAQATAQAAIIRAQGTAAAQAMIAGSPIRAIGAALNQAARGFGAGISASLRGVSSLVNSVTSAAMAPLRLLTGGGGLMALLGGGAAAGGVGFIAKEAMGLETSMVRLGRVTGLEGDRLKGLGDQFKGMAATMPGTSLESIFGIGTMGAKLGIQGADLAMFTRDVAKMSVVLEDIPIEEATTRMARLLNLFKRGPSDALGLASALNALDMASTASARDILDMTTRMGGMAATLKMTLPQTMALATAMREAGIEVGTGGTAMQQLLGRMAGKDAGKFAKIAGMDRGSFANLVDTAPMKALEAFFGRLQKMSPREAIKALESVNFVGARTRGTFLQLTQTFEKLAKFEGEANRQFGSGASITKGYANATATAEAQLSLLWNNLKLVAAALGEGLLPIIKGASRGFADLAKDVKASLEANRGTIIAWGERVGRVLDLVGLAWREFPLFVKLGIGYATQAWEQFSHIAKKFGGQFRDNFEAGMGNVFTFFENLFDSIGQLLDAFFSQLGPNISAHLHNATQAIAAGIEGSPVQKFLVQMIGGPAAGLNMAAAAAMPPMTPPGFKMPPGLFDAAKLKAGMGGLPGFNLQAAREGMPGRGLELAGIEIKIANAREKQVQAGRALIANQDALDARARAGARLNMAAAAAGRIQAFGARGQGGVPNARQGFAAQRRRMNAMLGGRGAMAAAARRRARNLAVQGRKARAQEAKEVPMDVEEAKKLFAAKVDEIKVVLNKIAVNIGAGAIFGGP